MVLWRFEIHQYRRIKVRGRSFLKPWARMLSRLKDWRVGLGILFNCRFEAPREAIHLVLWFGANSELLKTVFISEAWSLMSGRCCLIRMPAFACLFSSSEQGSTLSFQNRLCTPHPLSDQESCRCGLIRGTVQADMLISKARSRPEALVSGSFSFVVTRVLVQDKPNWKLEPVSVFFFFFVPHLLFFFVCLFLLFRDVPAAFGSFQVRGWIRVATASLHYSHSDMRSHILMDASWVHDLLRHSKNSFFIIINV